MGTNGTCDVCGGAMLKKGTVIVNSEFILLQCEKCHHQIARRV
jgi:hypothetical protein